jgi:hypothetical protein
VSKVPLDITAKSSKMPRNTAILYPKKAGQPESAGHYRGFQKFESGACFWVKAWVRTVNGVRVIEIEHSAAGDSQ